VSSAASRALQDQKKEGKQLCIDIINEVKEIKGVSGIHVMAYRQEEYVAEIVHESGVLKGRKPWQREARCRPVRSRERSTNCRQHRQPYRPRTWRRRPRITPLPNRR
jgi:hypothetical protein